MVDNVRNVCIVFDFENIEVCLRKKYELSLTEKGFRKILDFASTLGTVQLNNVLVGAFWDNFKSQKNIVTKTGTKRVSVPINTKNAADGALIVEIMKLKIIGELDKIDIVYLLAGDGGYGALIEYLYEQSKEVFISSIGGSDYTKPELLSLATNHKRLEDILEISDSSNNIEYTSKITLLPEWKAVIGKIRGLKRSIPFIDKNYLASKLAEASKNHPDLHNFDTKQKCQQLVDVCLQNQLLIPNKRNSEDGKIINTVEINESNPLVESLLP